VSTTAIALGWAVVAMECVGNSTVLIIAILWIALAVVSSSLLINRRDAEIMKESRRLGWKWVTL